MTRDEAKAIVLTIVSTYPNFKPTDLAFTVDTWANIFAEDEYRMISSALRKYIRTSRTGYAPTPGQLIDIAYSEDGKTAMTGQEAWSLVMNAMRNSAYNSEYEFSKLPEAVQRAVGSAERLRQLAITENLNYQVEMSLFVKTYEAKVEQHRKDRMSTPGITGENDDTKRLAELVKNTAMALPGRLPDR